MLLPIPAQAVIASYLCQLVADLLPFLMVWDSVPPAAELGAQMDVACMCLEAMGP